MRCTSGNDRGFALVMALAVLALLSIIAWEMVYKVQIGSAYHANTIGAARAGLMAQGGVDAAIATINRARGVGEPKLLQKILVASHSYQDELGEVTIAIEEEEGKLNLNLITLPDGTPHPFYDKVCRRLFVRRNIPEQMIDVLADWLDQNSATRSNGAESDYYRSLNTPYDAANRPMTSFGEFGLLKGAAPWMLDSLRPLTTVAASGAAVDLNSASVDVLMALDDRISRMAAEAVVRRRQETPFRGVGELAEIPGLSAVIPALAGWVGTTGSTYRIVANGRSGGLERTVEAVVRFEGNRYIFIFRREY